MSDFSPDLLLEIARTSDNHNRFLRNVPTSSSISFDYTDKAIINEFKDAIFTVLMLRAAESLKESLQKKPPESPLRAHTYFAMTLLDKDVHPETVVDLTKVEAMYDNMRNSASGLMDNPNDPDVAKNVILSGPITRRTLRAENETPIVEKIIDSFDNFTITLTCD